MSADIAFSRPQIGPEEEQAVLAVLRSGWLTTAGEALAFEQEFAAVSGASHSLAVSSATAGLHLALLAAGAGPGTTVITTPFTFVATVEAICHAGAQPVLVDIDRRTLNIDPDAVAAAFSRHAATVKAIVPVHVAGLPAPMEQIRAVAKAAGAAVIEDAAHCVPLPADPPALAGSDAAVFSFYANKNITSGEGGMVITDRDDLAREVAVRRLHGIDRPVWQRYQESRSSWSYDVVELGYKYNMPDLAAAIGRVQLRRATEFHARRRHTVARYQEAFADLEALELPAQHPRHAWHVYAVRLQPGALTLDREGVVAALAGLGIGTSVHFRSVHLTSYYARRLGLEPADLPIATAESGRVVSLPLYPGLSDIDVDRVITAVHEIVSRYRS